MANLVISQVNTSSLVISNLGLLREDHHTYQKVDSVAQLGVVEGVAILPLALVVAMGAMKGLWRI
jgi:hypothetical protein